MTESALRRWQRITAFTLFTGYAGYYVCRSNLSVATPLLLDAFGEQAMAKEHIGTVATPLILKAFGEDGLTKAHIGTIASAGLAAYTFGKIVNGILADYVGGRTMFLTGMLTSIACTVWFGLSSTLAAFVLIWTVNRFFQSMGWVALVKTASRWYPVSRHATVMGILSMSFLLGDALVRLFLGTCISIGEHATGTAWEVLADWRTIFFLAAASLAIVAAWTWRFLKSSPQDLSLEEPHANPANVYGMHGHTAARPPLWELLSPLLSSLLFWQVCAINFGLTLVRETFTFWTPTFLNEEAGFNIGSAGIYSLLFPLVGGISAFLGGVLSDRCGGRHGRIVVPCVGLLVVTLVVLAVVDFHGRPVVALALLCTVAFFLIAPYSYLSGVMALEFGGKRGSSTAAGLIDSAGYLGAILSGAGVGILAERYGWSTAFGALAGLCALTAVLAVTYWIRHERRLNALAGRDVIEVPTMPSVIEEPEADL